MLSALPFTYETRATRRTRRLRITIYPGGRVVLSRPKSAPERVVAQFLRDHSAWIVKEQARMARVVAKETLKGSRTEYEQYKELARARVIEALADCNQSYGFAYNRVSIKNMNSRWGSCSLKKNLNFHYRVAELRPELLRYLVVHELCHLKEMNHGARFWELVAKTVPDYQILRSELKKLYA